MLAETRQRDIADAPGETWTGCDVALKKANRGLPGSSSLPQLLAQKRGVRNHRALPRFRIKDILTWARTHRRQTGAWPTAKSGPIAGASENGRTVINALLVGFRGLPGGSSLAKLSQRSQFPVYPGLKPLQVTETINQSAKPTERRTQ